MVKVNEQPQVQIDCIDPSEVELMSFERETIEEI